MGDAEKHLLARGERNALALFSSDVRLVLQMQSHRTSTCKCVSEQCGVLLSLCVCVSVCVLVGEHLAGKWLSEQRDELGVCGHAFNELRTRPELKEKGWKI